MAKAIVVGGGHAGVEAALLLANKGVDTLLITLKISDIAKMPCNPSIGGPAKGIVVREIDALGGVMPRVADETALQFKMLNTSKGPGVQSLRVQSDKIKYSERMQEICLTQNNLQVMEAKVEDLIIGENKIKGIILENKEKIFCDVLILTTGTYMDSRIMISDEVIISGPDKSETSSAFSKNLKKYGFKLLRLKTGTPPRILTSSIDFSRTKEEKGTDGKQCFSELTLATIPYDKQVPCYLTYTNSKTHEIIKENMHRSSMYSGVVKGIGPRYCPSIEDKIARFSDKERHQLFLEPESLELDTTYLQGLSSSLPREVQEEVVHSLVGLENAVIKKYAYAIEYDSFDPLDFSADLQSKKIKGLFAAGQILATSGYEEAAGLGIMAGINAYNYLNNLEPFILGRDEAYIGVMIDDLVTKGTKEPYRLLTSRAEYRLLLRHDNAWERLAKYGIKYGYLNREAYDRYLFQEKEIESLMETINNTKISSEMIAEYLKEKEYQNVKGTYTLLELVKRPNIRLNDLLGFLNIVVDEKVIQTCEIRIKYDGYINKAKATAQRMDKLNKRTLPRDTDYLKLDNLRIEAREKLNLVKPKTLGQASRVSGINPADIQVLAMYLKKHKI